MNYIKHVIKRAWRESRGLNQFTGLPLAMALSYMLESGKTSTLVNLSLSIPIKLHPTIASYYFAHAHYLYGHYDIAREHLEYILKKKPYHADATYLLCSIDEIVGCKEIAWKRIFELVRNSRRLKTWLVMANMVSEEKEFLVLLREWHRAISEKHITPYHLDVNGYIATAALRAGRYENAITICKELLDQTRNNGAVSRNKPNTSVFSCSRAEKALLDLKKNLDKNKIEFFLISGTLLGCIREGRILSHDKDVDIGVWSDICLDMLLSAIRTSGLFYQQASRSQHVIRIKHVNGTAIDIFIHYKEPNNYWHGGVKLKWSNTPFELKTHSFLDTTFKVPQNYDLYLTENYGNWKIPKEIFDSSFDTENITIINEHEMTVYDLKLAAKSSNKHY